MFNFFDTIKNLFIKETPAHEAEIVARFVLEKSKYSIDKSKLRHSAFMPPKKSVEISVSCISDIISTPQQIWDIAINYFSTKTLARGDLVVQKIKKIRNEDKFLSVLVNGRPHKRHANIKKLPKCIPSNKSRLRAIATKLSDISSLVLR